MSRIRTFEQLFKEAATISEASVATLDPEDYPDIPETAFDNNDRPDDEDEVKRLNERCSRLIQKAKFAISKVTPTIGIFLSKLTIVLTYDPACPTMAVDRKMNIYINPKFSSKLTDAENVGVFVHETLHIINETGFRQKTRIHKWWNVATDYVMNMHITRDGFKLPKGGCIPTLVKGSGIDESDKWMVYLDITYENGQMVRHEWDIAGKSAEWLYNQFMRVIPEDQKDPDDQGKKPYDPQVGDVVFNKKTGEYGEVTSVGGGNVKVEPISKEEAKRRITLKQ